jgi:hypothetical protein
MSDGPFYSFGKVPIVDATANATFGTITLTAPSADGLADSTAPATFGTITLTAPTATAFQNNDATATATFGTITLTAPSATAFDSDATASASFGTITLFAPTAAPLGSRPPNNYQQQFYWGRHARGQYLHVLFDPLYITDGIPVVKFWREGTTLMRTMSLPIMDVEDAVFGQAILIDDDFIDGHYVAVVVFDVDHSTYAVINYFEIVGGTAVAPVSAVSEIQRPLGQAVISFRLDGTATIGYNASTFETQE